MPVVGRIALPAWTHGPALHPMVKATPSPGFAETPHRRRTVGRCGRKKSAANLRPEVTLRSEARGLAQ
jgi:hypothetical protein